MSRSVLINTEMNKVARKYLRAMAFIFTIFYSVRGLVFFITTPNDFGVKAGAACLVSAIIGWVIILLLNRTRINWFWTEVCFFLLPAILTINAYLVFYLDGRPLILVNTAFIIITIGLGTTRAWSWAFQIAVALATYFTAPYWIGYELDQYARTILFSGAVLSLLAFLSRVTVIKERILLDVELADKATKLEEANAAKDRFVANMTHELRTPLTGVMGMMDLMHDTKLDAEQTFMLENAQKSAGYLLNIVNDILDYAKLEAGKMVLNPEPIDLLQVARDSLGVFEAEAHKKGLRLALEYSENVHYTATADGIRVGQILLNLIGNAVKFTDVGSVIITLEKVPADTGALFCFKVEDTGPGIEEARAKHLFGRFEQADNTATRTTSGTGLGLAICSDLVELMAGEITLKSKAGKGSTFVVKLPFDSEGHSVGTSIAPQKSLNSQELVPVTTRRALLAEDNEINQTILIRMLEMEGFDVTLAENGQKALDVFQQDEDGFDMIFMDIQMPELDGVSVTRIIRLRDQKAPPIIAVTANTMEQDIQEYKAAGIVEILGKPVDRVALREVVEKYLGDSAKNCVSETT